MKYVSTFLIVLLHYSTVAHCQQPVTITGIVKDSATGEPLRFEYRDISLGISYTLSKLKENISRKKGVRVDDVKSLN
jgi:hypothetical protein